jgi:dTDP-glucose 4,6-dehydratase
VNPSDPAERDTGADELDAAASREPAVERPHDPAALAGARVVLTGGAGFLGSHLGGALLALGAEVRCIDNLLTGRRQNLVDLVRHPGFTLVEHDVTRYIEVPGRVDAVLHFASPASPADYLHLPIQTLKVGALGTHNALGLAKDKGATFMLASTSEVCGDPQVHPQPETYWATSTRSAPRRVRRGQALRRGHDRRLPPHPRHRRAHRPDLQHLRAADAHGRRGRCRPSSRRPSTAGP